MGLIIIISFLTRENQHTKGVQVLIISEINYQFVLFLFTKIASLQQLLLNTFC